MKRGIIAIAMLVSAFSAYADESKEALYTVHFEVKSTFNQPLAPFVPKLVQEAPIHLVQELKMTPVVITQLGK